MIPEGGMLALKQGGMAVFILLSVLILKPFGCLVISACLTDDWWGHRWCLDMGVRYPDYPTNTDGLNEFRKTSFGPTTVIWFQAGSGEWFRIDEVTTVRRNSSLGTDFDGKRVPGREDETEESPHVRLKNPCTSKSSRTTSHRTPVHLAKFAYSDGIRYNRYSVCHFGSWVTH